MKTGLLLGFFVFVFGGWKSTWRHKRKRAGDTFLQVKKFHGLLAKHI